MYSKVFFSNKKLIIYSSSFLLGILLSFSFEPFNLPFMSLIAVGMFFLVNDYIYQNLQNKKKIKLFYNQKNKGAAYCRNLAIKKSKSDYIAFIDSDDLWNKNKLFHQVNFMRKYNYSFTYI